MNIRPNDPLELVPYQSGLVATPLEETAAKGQSNLDTPQIAIALGTPVPIVFCRRIGTTGGVLVSPGATEGRFQNNGTTNELTMRLQLVVSEGELPPLQIRDVFQRACRIGTWKQAYDARAESWTPGNFITAVAGKEFWDCPVYCGTGGFYDNLTTLSFLNTYADGDQNWAKQLHCFVRQGMQVTRILDNTYGPSNNLIDLALYLIRESSRLPEDLLDLDGMEAAALFTDVNGLFFNGIFNQSVNLEDWLQSIAQSFILRVADKQGKKLLKPRLPVNNDGTINTGAISAVFTFTEEHVLPGGFKISYVPLEERKPIAAQVIWRQQPDTDIGIIRTTEVRLGADAANGPYQQYDLSTFCTSEDHAVKVGAYEVSKRRYVTHVLRLTVKPDAFNSTLVLGDIVRVQLRRETSVDQVSIFDYHYEVETINRDIRGSIELDLVHFPVNANKESVIAKIVDAAVGNGELLPTGRDNFDCDDEGRREDPDPIPEDPYVPPSPPVPPDIGDKILPDPDEPPADPPQPPPSDGPNPPDPIEPNPPEICGGSGPGGSPLPGDELSICDDTGPDCPGRYNKWYLVDENGNKTLVSAGVAAKYLILDPDLTGKRVYVVGCCPDPGSPSGYSECQESEEMEIGEPPVPPLYCPGGSGSGTQGTYSRLVNVGEGLGSFTFSWQAFTVPDSFSISGAASFSTGAVSGGGSATITKTSAGAWITVTVNAPLPGTVWSYSVGCTS
jgi:hypothetical protein